MKKYKWTRFKIFKFTIRILHWKMIGIEYRMKDGMLCDITISRYGISKQYLPF